MTAFASAPLLLCAILLIPNAFILVLAPNRDDPPPLSPVGIPRVPWSNEPSKEITTKAIIPLPALTVYRSHMLLMTFLAILAVDFPMFPRSLAKCETFGVSLVRPCIRAFFLHNDRTRCVDGHRCWLVRVLTGSYLSNTALKGSKSSSRPNTAKTTYGGSEGDATFYLGYCTRDKRQGNSLSCTSLSPSYLLSCMTFV